MRFYAKAKEININFPAIIMLLMAFRFVFARLHREKEYRFSRERGKLLLEFMKVVQARAERNITQ